MKTIIFLAAVLLFVQPQLAFGNETGSNGNADVTSRRYAECAAYYGLVHHAMISAGDGVRADAYRRLENTAKFYALLLAIDGGGQDQAFAATKGRFARYREKMQSEASGSRKNGAAPMERYHPGCQEAMENPAGELVEILTAMLGK